MGEKVREGWRKVRLRDVGNIITGKTPPTKIHEYYGSEHPFITPTDIKTFDIRYLDSVERYLSHQGGNYQKRLLLPHNSICYVCIGSTVGKMCLTKIPSFTNQQINSIICNESETDPYYLFYKLRIETPKIKSVADGKGSGKSIINKTEFENLEFNIPPLPTQRKIASILSVYDDLIENNTRRIQILEEMAQAIYKEWFINFRFPGHEKVKMVKSELGMIPEGWEVKNLGDMVEAQYGYTESASNEEIGPKFLRGTDINKTTYIDWYNVPFCKIGDTDFRKYKLKRGDIVIIRMADPGKVGIIEKDIDAVFASYLIRLKPISDKISPYYLFYFLLSEKYQTYITGASTGTTRKSASAGVVTGISFYIPPNYLLSEFDSQISLIREQLTLLLEKNTILRRTRDLLLPKLIRGEIEVEGMGREN